MILRDHPESKDGKKNLKKSSKQLHYIDFYTQKIKFIKTARESKWSPEETFDQLKKLFTPTQSNLFKLTLAWPHKDQTKNIQIILTHDIDKEQKSEKRVLNFYDKKNHFLKISLEKNKLLIEKISEQEQPWSTQDLDDIASQIHEILNTKHIKYNYDKPKKAPSFISKKANNPLNKNKLEATQQQQIHHRLNQLFLNNPLKNIYQFTFFVDWIDLTERHHLLEVNLSRDNAYKTWFLNENTFLNTFYSQHQVHAPQAYFNLDIKNNSKDIINLCFTSDAKAGELYNINKNTKLSGNEVVRIYSHFDQWIPIKKVVFCDVSRITPAKTNKEIPLRLICAIITGKTWYESKIPGVSLFEFKELKTHNNAIVHQNKITRLKALQDLQKLPLTEWYAMLPAKKQRILLALYENHFDQAGLDLHRRSTRVQLSEDEELHPFFSTTTTLQNLTQCIYEASKKQHIISDDLLQLVDLLCEGLNFDSDNALTVIDATESDVWIKTRVNELLRNSLFWIKERISDNKTEPTPRISFN